MDINRKKRWRREREEAKVKSNKISRAMRVAVFVFSFAIRGVFVNTQSAKNAQSREHF